MKGELDAAHGEADAARRALEAVLARDDASDPGLEVKLERAMAGDGAGVKTLRVDGGMVVNDALCQFLADILDVQVQRPNDVETTAKGAAVLAALGCGQLADLQDAASAWQLDRTFTAQMSTTRRQQLLDGYARAVAQALSG